ncbi:hypothetical protein [Cohnella abietis]|uniref:Tail fiber protein n=1 Tax=Cohnella abietis TaxID=2507935 RepID=A0A3T1D041_9BACL|nr:hypothetical protein [Cohnella abietis]BBI31462.1 hypothetical protein KCTCHS21_08610 [Cohnella abietis]
MQILPSGIKKVEASDNATVANMVRNDELLDQKITSYDLHVATTANAHGATSSATPNTPVQRDASGRAKIAAPAAADDIARKDTVDDALSTHATDYIRQPGYAVTTGSANAYNATLSPALNAYIAGVCLAVKIHANNSGAATINVNGLGAKSILDSKGNAMTAGKLKLDSVYTLRYNGTAFTLQGEGGEYGTAVATEVLSGKTFGTDAGVVAGNMIDRRGSTNASLRNLGVSGRVWTRPAIGYYEGLTDIYADDPNFISANFPANKTIFGLQGTMSLRSSSGGNSPGGSGNHWAPFGTTATDGVGVFARAAPPDGSSTVAYSGDQWIRIPEPNFTTANIPAGMSMFGMVGSGGNTKRFASGTTTTVINNWYHKVTVGGLNFTPNLIVVSYNTWLLYIAREGNFDGSFRCMYHQTANAQSFYATTTSQGTGVDQFRVLSNGFEMYLEFNQYGVQNGGFPCSWRAFEM